MTMPMEALNLIHEQQQQSGQPTQDSFVSS